MLRLRVDVDAAHQRQVDDQPALDEWHVPRELWPPPRTATSSPSATREADRLRRRRRSAAGRQDGGALVDEPVEQAARLVVGGVVGPGQDAVELGREGLPALSARTVVVIRGSLWSRVDVSGHQRPRVRASHGAVRSRGSARPPATIAAVIERYTRPEMGAIWTDEAKMEAWRRVEVAAAEELDGPTRPTWRRSARRRSPSPPSRSASGSPTTTSLPSSTCWPPRPGPPGAGSTSA